MGRDKAVLPIDGVPMARRVADALLAAGAEPVVAAGGDAAGLAAAGLEVRPDSVPGGGPLPAVIDALEGAPAGADAVLVAGCDLVAPDPAAMAALVAALRAEPAAHVAVPLADGTRQWHLAAWRPSARGPLANARGDGVGSLRKAVAGLTVLDVPGIPPAAVADADTPADLPADLP